jgi:predicted glycosyl hydrolase (DUF1957 family)
MDLKIEYYDDGSSFQAIDPLLLNPEYLRHRLKRYVLWQVKIQRLREKEMAEEEAQKRVEARLKLRDQGMAHCFDKDLMKRFIITFNKAKTFNLSGLL